MTTTARAALDPALWTTIDPDQPVLWRSVLVQADRERLVALALELLAAGVERGQFLGQLMAAIAAWPEEQRSRVAAVLAVELQAALDLHDRLRALRAEALRHRAILEAWPA